MTVVNKIIHRFIRDRKDYEQGGELYGQIIPYNVQAYSYTLKENGDINNPNDYIVKYVLGTGSSTYLEIAEGRGRDLENQPVPELSKELLVSSQDQLEDIINAIFDYDGVKYTLNVGEDLHKTINLTDKNTLSIEVDNELHEVFGQNEGSLWIGNVLVPLNLDSKLGIITINDEKTVATEESVADVYLTKKDAGETYTTISNFNKHATNYSNPHNVTKAQVGLSEVDNTSDANKPVSEAQQAALDLKADKQDTYTKSEVDGFIAIEKERIETVEKNLNSAIQEEASLRQAQDEALSNSLTNEANARKEEDSKLTTAINTVKSDLNNEVIRATTQENTLSNTISGINTRVVTIENKIPEQASATNKLADKAFVNSSIQTAASNFRGSWKTYADIPTDANLYPADYLGIRTPSSNDYLIVRDACDYDDDSNKNKLNTNVISLNVDITPDENFVVDFRAVYLNVNVNGTIRQSDGYCDTDIGTLEFVIPSDYESFGVGRFVRLEANTEYTLSSINEGKIAIAAYNEINPNTIKYSGIISEKTTLPHTFTTNSDEVYCIIFYADDNNVPKELHEIQLEKGNTVTQYVPATMYLKGTWRFKYVGKWEIENKKGWLPEYRVNEDPLTQAQIEAINSGITEELVSSEHAPSIIANNKNIVALTLAHNTLKDNFEQHLEDFENPHKVTKAQLGLENVDNTSDINKPISTATQEALNLKANRIAAGIAGNILVVDTNRSDYADSNKAFKTTVSQVESDDNILTGLAIKTYVDAQDDTKQQKFTVAQPLSMVNNTLSIVAYKGAGTATAGVMGAVPSSTAGNLNRFLNVDGTWKVVPHPVRKEIDLSSRLNGVTKVFTLDEDIGIDHDIYLNGLHLRKTKNYTVEGLILTLLGDAPGAGEDLLIVYRK